MKLKLEINLDSDALSGDDGPLEAARLLREVADNLEGRWLKLDGKDADLIRDINGNKVGRAFTE